MKARRIGNSCMKGPLFTLQAITIVNLDGGWNQPKPGRERGCDLPARNPLGHPRASLPPSFPGKCFVNEK